MEKKYNKGKALPVETRLRIYKKALKMYEKERFIIWPGLCLTLKGVLKHILTELGEHVGWYEVYLDDHPYLLPEMWDFRTKELEEGGDMYWYHDDQERIEALKKAIKLLTKA